MRKTPLLIILLLCVGILFTSCDKDSSSAVTNEYSKLIVGEWLFDKASSHISSSMYSFGISFSYPGYEGEASLVQWGLPGASSEYYNTWLFNKNSITVTERLLGADESRITSSIPFHITKEIIGEGGGEEFIILSFGKNNYRTIIKELNDESMILYDNDMTKDELFTFHFKRMTTKDDEYRKKIFGHWSISKKEYYSANGTLTNTVTNIMTDPQGIVLGNYWEMSRTEGHGAFIDEDRPNTAVWDFKYNIDNGVISLYDLKSSGFFGYIQWNFIHGLNPDYKYKDYFLRDVPSDYNGFHILLVAPYSYDQVAWGYLIDWGGIYTYDVYNNGACYYRGNIIETNNDDTIILEDVNEHSRLYLTRTQRYMREQ